jgi:hypothetical protein
MKNKTIKQLLVTVSAAVLSVGLANGQGTVLFDSFGTTTDASVKDQSGQPIVDTANYLAQLYGSVGTSMPIDSLTPIQAAGSGGNEGSPTHFAGFGGYWLGGVVQVPGVVAGTAMTMMAVAWDSRTGATYATAGFRGHSDLFNYTLGGVGVPPPPPSEIGAALHSFQVVSVVPEPSTFALLGLGTGVLLFFRRRN